jgi:hypothetical protein
LLRAIAAPFSRAHGAGPTAFPFAAFAALAVTAGSIASRRTIRSSAAASKFPITWWTILSKTAETVSRSRAIRSWATESWTARCARYRARAGPMAPYELRELAELTATQHVVAIVIKPNEQRFQIRRRTAALRTTRPAATFRAARLRATSFRTTFTLRRTWAAASLWTTIAIAHAITIRLFRSPATLWATVAIATALVAWRRLTSC